MDKTILEFLLMACATLHFGIIHGSLNNHEIQNIDKEYTKYVRYNLSKYTINPSVISAECYEDLLYMTDASGFGNRSYSGTPEWQNHMLDAYGKLPSGLLEGNVMFLGEFTQCTIVEVWKNNHVKSTRPNFKGKYCLHHVQRRYVELTHNSEHQIPIIAGNGICVPSTCTAADVETLIGEYMYPLGTVVKEEMCRTNEPTTPDDITYLAFIPIILLAFLVVATSAYEALIMARRALLRQQNERSITATPNTTQRTVWKILQSFSAIRNTRKLMSTATTNDNLAFINGIRAISMFFVVGCHTLMIALSAPTVAVHNPTIIVTSMQKLYAQPIIYATYTVETFFCMTGFLLLYTVLEHGIKLQKFSIIKLYIHRFYRLTPAFLLLTVFAMGPFKVFGDGPLWTQLPFITTENCRSTLWRTPLYISIYYDIERHPTCMAHTWYLDTEMFLYFTSPIILYPMFKQHWSGPVLLAVGIVSSFTATTIIAYVTKAENLFSMYANGLHVIEGFKHLYVKPWGRAQTFLMGMLFGYLYYYKGKDLKLTKTTVAWCWFIITAGMLTCLFINYPYSSGTAKYPPTRLYYTLYIPISQCTWSFCIGLLIFLCAAGYGGVVNKILSWRLFAPIGRLSYCGYMVHLMVLAHFGGTRKYTTYVDIPFMYFSFLTTNFVTLIAAYILCMMVESPSVALEVFLFNRKRFQDEYKSQIKQISGTPLAMVPNDEHTEKMNPLQETK